MHSHRHEEGFFKVRHRFPRFYAICENSEGFRIPADTRIIASLWSINRNGGIFRRTIPLLSERATGCFVALRGSEGIFQS
jgi:hypothetical protein